MGEPRRHRRRVARTSAAGAAGARLGWPECRNARRKTQPDTKLPAWVTMTNWSATKPLRRHSRVMDANPMQRVETSMRHRRLLSRVLLPTLAGGRDQAGV